MLKLKKIVLTGIFSTVIPLGFCPAARADGPAAEIKYRSDISADELASLLGAYVWKFDVVLPKGTSQVTVAFQERDKSGASQGLGSMTAYVDPGGPTTLLVAMVPIGGDITDADKVRVVLTGFNSTMSQTIDNPLKSFAVGGPHGQPPKYNDGAFGLLGGYQTGQITSPVTTQADIALALLITPQTGQ